LVQLISIADVDGPDIEVPSNFTILDNRVLNVSEREAVIAAGGSMEEADAVALAEECQSRFGEFVAKLDPTMGVGGFWADDNEKKNHGTADTLSQTTILQALLDRGRWIEAFELACTHLPHEARRVVRFAGHQLIDIGAFEYLWDGLSSLPEEAQRDPDIAYWLVVAASATNRVKEIRNLADEVLATNEAPELRAAVAVLHPSENMVTEAARAVKAMETPTTLRAMGFALANAGDRKSPVELFRRAMGRAEALRANHLVIACAIDLANQEITLGRYGNGVNWAQWAVHELARRRTNEPLRRHAALALIAYGTILSGTEKDLDSLAPLVGSLGVDWTRIGAPTYESVVSTIGDWHFASGNLVEAEEYYRGLLDRVPLTQHASAALDVVRVLVAQGRFMEARSLAEAARTIAATSTATERALADLALGIARAASHHAGAVQALNAAIGGLAKTSYVIFEAQAFLWLALTYLSMGRTDLAGQIINKGSEGIAGLGEIGWKFLLCGSVEGAALREIWRSTSSFLHLSFLGAQKVTVNGATSEASLRTCEILALLSENEAGLSGERLRLMVFGDDSTATNTKATISRMRKQFPISQSPYRLRSRVASDFGELLRHIENGDLHKALSLYRGPLLPDSESPAIVDLRNFIDDSLKSAVVATNDVELMIRLGNTMEDELEVWEKARSILPHNDSRRGLVNARIRRIKAYWDL
jgi:tetratricopeptide (TPR) repeat protein